MLLKFIQFYSRRNFSRCNICKNIEKAKVSETGEPASTSTYNRSSGTLTKFKPSEWEKKVLVWSGKYKSKDIPPTISYSTLDNAQSRLRIRISNILMVGTLCLCGYYVWAGKERQKKGDTITRRELERKELYKTKTE